MKKTVIILMIITITSKLFGFFREVALSYFYGASDISDVYIIATSIPGMLMGFVMVGIGAGFVPIYSEIQKSLGEKEAEGFAGNLLNILLLATLLVFILGEIFAGTLVRIIASGFEGETFTLAVEFTRIALIGIFFIALGEIFKSLLEIKGNFKTPALKAFPMNLVLIATILLSARYGAMLLAVGYILSWLIQVLYMLPSVKTVGYRHHFKVDFKDRHLKKIITLAIPLIIGVSAGQINVLVDRTLASRIAIGGISALSYAHRLQLMVHGIFAVSIITVMYPMLSRMAAEADLEGFKKNLGLSILGTNLLLIPSMVGLLMLATPIVTMIFGRGAFDAEARALTSGALFFYATGITAYSLRDIFSKAYFSLQDSRTPMIIGVIGVIINIILNFTLSSFMGINGLALATSLSAGISGYLLIHFLRKKIGGLGMKALFKPHLKILLASLMMGWLTRVSFEGLLKGMDHGFALLVAIGIGGSFYLMLIYFMKIEAVDLLVKQIKERIRA